MPGQRFITGRLQSIFVTKIKETHLPGTEAQGGELRGEGIDTAEDMREGLLPIILTALNISQQTDG